MIAQAGDIDQFFFALYGQDAPGWLVIWTKQDKLPRWYETHNIPEVAARCRELAGSFDVYYGIGLQGQKLASNQRGKVDRVIAIPGLWLDIDCQGGTHTATNLPTFEEARDFLTEFPLPPSIVVHSGGGLHVYWLFRQLWTFRNNAEREQAVALVARFQQAFIALAGARGWKLDNTSDLARVLRVPGTLNHKGAEPVPVRVLEFEPARRYGYKEIAQAIDALAAKVPRQERGTTRREPTGEEDRPEAALILERCAFIRHCRDDAAALSEPEWYAMLTIMARTDGGPELCHELSRPYPKYNPRETDEKIKHALEDTGPYTCQRIRQDFGAYCRGCQERVTSPIVLGMAMPVVPPLEEVQPFPLEALPDCLVPLVTEAARANSCPPDFIAVPMLTVLGVAIGNSRILQVKPGWRFKANLYTNIIAAPGSGKSPAQGEAAAPVKELQKQMAREYEKAIQKYEEDMAQWEAECAQARMAGEAKPRRPEEPVMREIFTTDTTTEALAQALSQNPRGMLLLLDELTAWVNGLNQYKGGRGADREYYLSFWSGTTTKVNRVKKAPLILPSPFLAVTGCMPPAVLDTLVDERGRGEDGFIHRILFSYPDPVPQWWTEETMSETARKQYREVFEKLWKLEPNADGTPQVVTLTPDAYSLWVECYNENTRERMAPDFPENLQGPWAKMPSQAARLALIIHMCRLVSGETTSGAVDKKSMAKAWLLVDYFKSHARRVYRQLKEDPEDKGIRRVVEWCRKHGKDGVTPRELARAGICKTADDAKSLLEVMKKRGLGYFQEHGGGRGRRKSVFMIRVT
ncbi:Protein of unknown function [Desulfofundulus australicus DSM 11792]|uniref:Primase C terminal 1 (PriCT-1) n=1 Tax=Desulfofundulus australicus DSM 11792 TaxID=1121425 RepID=A0A1M5DUG8_9FIRM|nr:YfjI family protein [Desulfofundulus australicus]SHF70570.1 Protein of unknown function [Desulfofundulus australicus DSM 11792]